VTSADSVEISSQVQFSPHAQSSPQAQAAKAELAVTTNKVSKDNRVERMFYQSIEIGLTASCLSRESLSSSG